MRFDTSATPVQVAANYHYLFKEIVDRELWNKRIAGLRQEIANNSLLEEMFIRRYYLEFELSRLQQDIARGQPIETIETYGRYQLLAFITIVARVHRRLTERGNVRLSGMLRAGLKDEYGLSSLQHEMHIVTHLMARGFDVEFPDIEGEGLTSDLIATKHGVAFEVEAKVFSGDVGRRIHLRRLYQFGGKILPHMSRALDARDGIQFLRAVIPDRLSGHEQQISALKDNIGFSLANAKSTSQSDVCSVDFTQFALSGTIFQNVHPENVNLEDARKQIEGLTGYPARNVLVMARPFRGVVAISIESARQDRVLYGIVKRLKRLVKSQISHGTPVIIAIKFLDITEDELTALHDDSVSGKNSTLAEVTSYLLNRKDWRQVHTLAYSAPGHVTVSASETQGAGLAYVFANPHNILAADARFRVFASSLVQG
jgi:hypothetical protein